MWRNEMHKALDESWQSNFMYCVYGLSWLRRSKSFNSARSSSQFMSFLRAFYFPGHLNFSYNNNLPINVRLHSSWRNRRNCFRNPQTVNISVIYSYEFILFGQHLLFFIVAINRNVTNVTSNAFGIFIYSL
jgi:hypothetical protein